MLVLTRREGESLKIGNGIEITVKQINPSHIDLRINNSKDIIIDKWKNKITQSHQEATLVSVKV